MDFAGYWDEKTHAGIWKSIASLNAGHLWAWSNAHWSQWKHFCWIKHCLLALDQVQWQASGYSMAPWWVCCHLEHELQMYKDCEISDMAITSYVLHWTCAECSPPPSPARYLRHFAPNCWVFFKTCLLLTFKVHLMLMGNADWLSFLFEVLCPWDRYSTGSARTDFRTLPSQYAGSCLGGTSRWGELCSYPSDLGLSSETANKDSSCFEFSYFLWCRPH